jgi:hypothetical protein
MVDLPLTARLRQLLSAEDLHDRPTLLLRAYRELWDALGNDAERELGDALVSMLQDTNHLKLARIVLPAFRFRAEPPEHQPQRQRECVETTAKERARLDRLVESTQHDFNDAYYKAERKILQEAEMHRLRLLLFESGVLDQEQAHNVRRWLDGCPLQACDGNGRGGAMSGDDHKHLGSVHARELTLPEADLHNLRLLLFCGSTLTHHKRLKVLDWLEQCPVPARGTRVC